MRSDYLETSGIMREIYQKIIREDQSANLPKISIPTLIVWGDRDRQTPLRQGKKIAKLIPNSQLKIISGGPHGLHHAPFTACLLKQILRYAQDDRGTSLREM